MNPEQTERVHRWIHIPSKCYYMLFQECACQGWAKGWAMRVGRGVGRGLLGLGDEGWAMGHATFDKATFFSSKSFRKNMGSC